MIDIKIDNKYILDEMKEKFIEKKQNGKRKITESILKEYLKNGNLCINDMEFNEYCELDHDLIKEIDKELKKSDSHTVNSSNSVSSKSKKPKKSESSKSKSKKSNAELGEEVSQFKLGFEISNGDDGNSYLEHLDIDYNKLHNEFKKICNIDWEKYLKEKNQEREDGDYRKNNIKLIYENEEFCIYDWFNPDKPWKNNKWYISGNNVGVIYLDSIKEELTKIINNNSKKCLVKHPKEPLTIQLESDVYDDEDTDEIEGYPYTDEFNDNDEIHTENTCASIDGLID